MLLQRHLGPVFVGLAALFISFSASFSVSFSARAAGCEPVDEALYNLGFARFRTQLLQISARKDVQALQQVVSPQIKMSFGDQQGWKAFVENWALDKNPERSNFWEKLDETLTLGGRFTNPQAFMAPYPFHCKAIKDAYTDAVVIAKNVSLREAPTTASTLLGQLSFTIVEIIEEQRDWAQVKTDTGQTGYIAKLYLRRPIDYRAGFTQTDEGWRMDFFVAGD